MGIFEIKTKLIESTGKITDDDQTLTRCHGEINRRNILHTPNDETRNIVYPTVLEN